MNSLVPTANSFAYSALKRFCTLRTFTTVLFWLGMVRIFYVAIHDPMMGFANQYDMGRTAACLDLWPDFPTGPADRAYPEAPIEKHRLVRIASQGCYPSAEVVIDKIVLATDAPRRYLLGNSDLVDLRVIGFFKALLLMSVAWIIRRALIVSASADFLHAMVFFLVLADPIYTLYFNTLYGEFAATFGMYAAIASIVAFVILGRQSAELLCVFCVGTLSLAFSRMQHLVLPFLFIALFAYVQIRYVTAKRPLWWRRAWCICVAALLMSSVAAVVVNIAFLDRNPVFKSANRINMLMGAFVPASENPGVTIQALGLPATCSRAVYSSFYTQFARATENACPETLSISSARLLQVMLLEPKTTLTMWGRGIVQSGAWRLPTVGEVANTKFQRVGAGPMGLSLSFNAFARSAGLNSHLVFWLLPLIAGVMVLLFFAYPRRDFSIHSVKRNEVAAAIVCIFLALVVASAWASALVGDGYSEILRHVHLGLMAALASWTLMVGFFFQRRLFVALLITLAVVPLATIGFRSLPLAIGELRGALDPSPLKLGDSFTGWVVAPYGVAGVDIDVAGQRTQHVSVHASPTLQALMPMASGRHAYEFTVDPQITNVIVQKLGYVDAYVVRFDGSRQRFDRR
jgi:hypothetical protein